MKNKVVVSILMLSLAACGGGGGGEAPSSTSAPAADTSASGIDKTISSDGEALAIAMYTGSNEANGASQTSSANTKDMASDVKTRATDLLIAKIGEKLQNEVIEPATNTKAIHVSSTNAKIDISFDNEKFVFGGGTITFNGPIVFTKTSDTSVTVTASISAAFSNVTVSPTVRGKRYDETINGSITLALSANYDFILNSSQTAIRWIETVGDVSFTGSNIQLTGTANGSINSMSPSAHLEGNIYSSGYDFIGTCSGSISVTVNGQSGSCNIGADCDTCQ